MQTIHDGLWVTDLAYDWYRRKEEDDHDAAVEFALWFVAALRDDPALGDMDFRVVHDRYYASTIMRQESPQGLSWAQKRELGLIRF